MLIDSKELLGRLDTLCAHVAELRREIASIRIEILSIRRLQMMEHIASATPHAQEPQVARAPSNPQPAERPDETAWMRQKDICERLGISDETWRNWRQRGRTPPAVEAPGHPKWRRADIEDMIAGRRWKVPGRRSFFNTAR